MRRALALSTVLLAWGAPAAHAQSVALEGADPEAYALDLRYADRGAGVLSGTERIHFVNLGPGPLATVWLRLWANGPDRCRPRRISVRIEPPAVAGGGHARCTALPVSLVEPVPEGGSGSLSLRFVVRGRRDRDRFGRSAGVSLLGNVIPVLAVEDERGLHLDPYVRFGDSFYSLSATWDATLRLPARLRAATTGAVISETVDGPTRSLVVRSGQARDFALAIGRMRLVTGVAAGTRVRVFTPPGGGRAALVLRHARRALRLLSRRLGPYDAAEYDVVNVHPGFGGMEYPELVFTRPLPELVSHETAHQWWYGVVGNDQFRSPWLDESFAQYFTERLHPGVDFCPRGRPFRFVDRRWRNARLDAPMRAFSNGDAFGQVVYFAGACALHTLERDIGGARMTSLLRTLVARNRHGVMTKADLLAAIREVAPGYRLRRWLRVSHLSLRSG